MFMKLVDTFQKFIEYERQNGLTEKTITEHKRFLCGSLSHSIQDKEIGDLRLTDIAAVKEAGKAHGEYGSQRSVHVFRRLMNYLHDNGIALPFDYRDIKLPSPPKRQVIYLTDEEIEKLRNACKLDNLTGLRTRALIEVLYDTGMRTLEAISLNRDDIDWDNKEAKIINAKTKEPETVYLTDRSVCWLKKYLEARNDKFEPLFATYVGKRVLQSDIRRTLINQTKEAGITKRINPRIFRKSLVTTLLHNGVDIKTVQGIARHKSPRTTLRFYAAIDLERVKIKHQEVMGQK